MYKQIEAEFLLTGLNCATKFFYFKNGMTSAQNFFAIRKYSNLDDRRLPDLKSTHVQPGLWRATDKLWFFTALSAVTTPGPAINILITRCLFLKIGFGILFWNVVKAAAIREICFQYIMEVSTKLSLLL